MFTVIKMSFNTPSETIENLKNRLRQWKYPTPDENVISPRGKPKIEVYCKKYAMILVNDNNLNLNRPKRQAFRRSFRSKSKTPVPSEQFGTPVRSATTQSRTMKQSKPNPDALGTLNVNIQKRVRFKAELVEEPKKYNRDRLKRKRLVGDADTAENIPLELVLPKLEYGINKNICPQKKIRLQSLFSPESKSEDGRNSD